MTIGNEGELRRIVVNLTPEESKRLVAKAVVELDEVKKAKEDGLIGLARCSSAAYVIEELLGRPLPDPGRYLSGFISGRVLCAAQTDYQERLLVLQKGKENWLDYTQGNVTNFIDHMGAGDVIVKSGNAIDPFGQVGCLVAAPNGGEIGAYLPHILAKGINLVVPMTVNKTVSTPIERLVESLGISRQSRSTSHGLLCGMMPMPGLVITEVEAIEILCGAEAVPVAVGGIGDGAGAAVLMIEGGQEEVSAAWNLIQGIKNAGEKPLPQPPSPCDDCYILQHPEMGALCSSLNPPPESS